MYIPREYEQKDQAEIIAFMKRYSFAIVVTHGDDDIPLATHLPFYVYAHNDEVHLTAHFAMGNLQWKGIEDKNVLVIFSQPHAYISPSHYSREQSVPTWNYVAVHAHGKCRVITDTNEGVGILEQMIMQSEPAYKQQWDGLSPEYKAALYKGIVPIDITITKLEAVNKLSQDKSEHERHKIIDTLSSSTDTAEQDIAEYMKKNTTA
ncbi:MAG: FMN-binding negative transcriptional regulator [Bacteroidota bacterium]